jgi:hypothetical protein
LNAYNNLYTATSVAAFSASGNPALRKPTYVAGTKAFELGYRSS